MTPAEKAKLYAAIGYSETAVNPNLPKNVSDKQSWNIQIHFLEVSSSFHRFRSDYGKSFPELELYKIIYMS